MNEGLAASSPNAFLKIYRLGWLALLLYFSSLCAPHISIAEDEPAKHILLLYAYEQYAPLYQVEDPIIRDFLETAFSAPLEFYSECLDLNRFPQPEYLEQLVELHRQKYATRRPDLIVAIATEALDYVLTFGEELFPGTPVVFGSIDARDFQTRTLRDNITGSVGTIDFEGTLKAALALQPDTQSVVVIGGTTPLDRMYLEIVQQELQAYEDRLTISYIADELMEQLLETVAHLPKHTIVYYIHLLHDGRGDAFVPRDVAAELARSANVPVYSFLDTFLGSGIVGGSLISVEALATTTAELALRVLQGERPAEIPIENITMNVPLFDWRALRRWNLSERKLPAGSQIKFREYSLWDLYHWQILGITFLVFTQSAMIAGLLIHRAKLRQAEKTAQVNLEKYRVLFESFPLGVTITNRQGHIIETNQQAALVLGLSKQEHETRSLDGTEWKIFRSDGSPMPYHEYPGYLSIQEHHTISNVEMAVAKANGELVWLSVTAAPIPLEGYGSAVTYKDISDRKRAEEELHSYREHLEELIEERTAELAEERNLLRTLIDNMPDLILVKNTESRFLMLNPALAHLMGATVPEDLLGKTDFDFYPREFAQQYYDLEHIILQSGEPSLNQEELHYDPDTGEERWFLSTKIPFRDQQGVIRGLVGISRDITAHKQLEETLRKQRDHLESLTAELETANRELKDFAYVVSHDLKAPLRGVVKLTHWLTEDYRETIDDKGRKMADLLIDRVKRMDSLIEGILRYSRIGRVHEKDVTIDLNVLLHEVLDLLDPPEHIQISIAPNFPTIIAERTRMFQIFQNLISNAVKFLNKPRGEITIQCVDEETHWTFRVADNGPGIEPHHQEKIFQIFQTLEPCDAIKSTGIGLALVKKIVELYGGKIGVESKMGNGATFWFTFPKNQIATGETEAKLSTTSI